MIRSNYLLIVSPGYNLDGRRISSEELARHRIQTGLWGLNANTPHRKEIKEKDNLIVYLAGENKRIFFASAVIDKVSHTPQHTTLDGPDSLGTPPSSIITLCQSEIFKRPIHIGELKQLLSFIPQNNPKWGCVMQRGMKRISQKDYNIIIDNIYKNQ
jgi:hypothetical protein